MPDKLRDLWNTGQLTPESAELVNRARALRERLSLAGISTEDAEPRESLFMNVLNTLQKPTQIVEGIADSAFIRQDLFDIGPIAAAQRGMEERISGADMLRRLGVENPVLRGIAGFGIDVFTDPLMYVTGGSHKAAMAGGRALSQSGVKLKSAMEAGAVLKGALPGKISEQIDNAFDLFGKFKDELNALQKTEQGTLAYETVAKRVTSLKEELSPALQWGQDVLGRTIDETDIAAAFKKPSLRLGINVPFLGHIAPEAREVVEEAVAKGGPSFDFLIKTQLGPIKKGLAAASKAVSATIKPRWIGKEWEIPEPFLEATANVTSHAQEGIKTLLSAAGEIPVVGSLTRAGEDIAKTGSKLFKEIFARKMIEGKAGHYARTQYENAKASARYIAERDTKKRFGEFLLTTDATGQLIKNTEGIAQLKEGMLLVDGTVMNPLRRLFQQAEEMGARLPAEHPLKIFHNAQKEWDSLIDRAVKGADDIKDVEFLKDAPLNNLVEQEFQAGVQALLADTTINAGTKKAIRTIVDSFNDIAAQEKALGIKTGFLESYIPHRYNVIGNTIRRGGSAINPSFTYHRKYATLSDALQEGLIGETDVAALYARRLQQSLTAQAARKYAHRMMLHYGLPMTQLKTLYNAAKENPGGAEWALLQRYQLGTPRVLTAEEKLAADSIRETELKGRAIYNQYVAGKTDPEQLTKAILDAEPTLQGMGVEFAKAASKFDAAADAELLRQGVAPADFMLPKAFNGEIGKVVKLPEGEYVVPREIGQAIEETLRSKDWLRRNWGKTEVGSKFLNLFDSTVSWMKRWVLSPFPAYWGTNMFGDRMMAFMDAGIHAFDPGYLATTFNVLSGKSGIRNKATGIFYDPQTINKFLRDNGMPYKMGDLLDIIDDVGRLDLDKVLRSEKSILANLTGKGSKGYALAQAQEALHSKFESFPRIAHFIHRLQEGDTLQSALYRANEALINYRDLSPIEQSFLRRFYFFYGWMSKSTKKALTSLMTQPGDLTFQLKSARALSEFFSDPKAAPTADQFERDLLSSVTQAEQITYAIGKGKDGKALLARGFGLPLNTILQQFSINAPRNFSIGELVDTAADSAHRTLQKQFASANPIINTIAQQIAGKNLYFDKPLDSAFLRRIPSLAAIAKKVGVYEYSKIPVDLLDDTTKKFLGGVPDGQGRFVANPGKFWVLVNLVPAIARVISQGNALARTDTPIAPGILNLLSNTKIEEQDPSRAYLSTYMNNLEEISRGSSYGLRRKAAYL